jgi:hypothetical protein
MRKELPGGGGLLDSSLGAAPCNNNYLTLVYYLVLHTSYGNYGP